MSAEKGKAMNLRFLVGIGGLLIAAAACTGFREAAMDVRTMPVCRMTTYDPSSDTQADKQKRPVLAYIRSSLITERIRISNFERGNGLRVWSTSVGDLEKNDLIESVYGKRISGYASFFDFLELNVNRTVDLGIVRNGKNLNIRLFNPPCRYFSSGEVERVFYNELYSGRLVNLLVLEPKVVLFSPDGKQSAESSMKKLLTTDPRMATSLYGIVGFDNFRILQDRHVETVLKELELKQLGLLDEGTAVKVGKMVGANFVAETTVRFFGDSNQLQKMEVIKKVYNLELGTIAGVDSIKVDE